MSGIKEELISYVEQLQEKADNEAGYMNYPKHLTILPNDAIYLTRLTNLSRLCELIETLVSGSGRSLKEVISLSLLPNRHLVLKQFPFTEEAFDAIAEKFGK